LWTLPGYRSPRASPAKRRRTNSSVSPPSPKLAPRETRKMRSSGRTMLRATGALREDLRLGPVAIRLGNPSARSPPFRVGLVKIEDTRRLLRFVRKCLNLGWLRQDMEGFA
jgi:hypothetical protein